MTEFTLLIAIAGSILVLSFSAVNGLILYVALLAWFPTYLSVQVGTIDFTICRIVILAFFAGALMRRTTAGSFRFIWLDKLIIIYYMAQLVAGATTSVGLGFVENRAGAIFDTVLPYFAVRITITSKQQYLRLLKGMLFCAAPLAALGLYQCFTGRNLLDFIPGQFYTEPAARFGLYRAGMAFSVSIMFGLYFAMLGPTCVGLWRSIKENKWQYGIALSLMFMGVFASMSSGPLLGALFAGLFIAFFRFRRYWKVAVTVIVLMCGAVEVISNRHFYDVLGKFTLSPQTAWYRSRLIDVALFQGGMSGHWLTGYGLVDPGWSAKIDGRGHTDVVNDYILTLCRFGLVGLIPFIAVVAQALNMVVKSYRLATSEDDSWLIWCLLGALFGTLVSMFSVSLFGPPVTVLYLLFGFCGAMPLIPREEGCRL